MIMFNTNMAMTTTADDLNLIFDHLSLDSANVTNVYNYGSRVHGSATASSDYDILVIGNFAPSIMFKNPKKPYFHKYQLHTLTVNNKKYDVVLYNNEEFESTLKYNYLISVECIFNPPEFIHVNKIDYKKIYLDKYFDQKLVRTAVKTEVGYALNCINRYHGKRLPVELDDKWVVKKLFNSIRYHTTALQLITTKNISDYGKTNYIKQEIAKMYQQEKSFTIISDYLKRLIDDHATVLDDAIKLTIMQKFWPVAKQQSTICEEN